MAAAGLRFTQGYSNSPVCSHHPLRDDDRDATQVPARAAPPKSRSTASSRGSATLGLPPEHPTPALAAAKAQGYRTALVGKWHLGLPARTSALCAVGLRRASTARCPAVVDYFSPLRRATAQHDLWQSARHWKPHDIGYLTDLISQPRGGRGATNCADDPADAPFLLSLHYTAPHWPWETRDDRGAGGSRSATTSSTCDGGNIHTYRRMIHHMDEGIGRLLARRWPRTRCSWPTRWWCSPATTAASAISDNWPLVGGKMDLTEGGIRVPWIAQWPEVIAPGRA